MAVSSPVLCTTELLFLHRVLCVDKEQRRPPPQPAWDPQYGCHSTGEETEKDADRRS